MSAKSEIEAGADAENDDGNGADGDPLEPSSKFGCPFLADSERCVGWHGRLGFV